MINDDYAIHFDLQKLTVFLLLQKDHLLNQNEEFDYGPFDRLGEIMTTTDAEYYTFVHEFSNAGPCTLSDCHCVIESYLIVTLHYLFSRLTSVRGVSLVLKSSLDVFLETWSKF